MSEEAAMMLCDRCGRVVGTGHNRPECDAFYRAAFDTARDRVTSRRAVATSDSPSRDALAEVLCPPHHREGFGGTITNADGTSRSLFSKRRPCLLHASQADAILASGVLDAVRADAWNEGCAAGWTDVVHEERSDNPYRSHRRVCEDDER